MDANLILCLPFAIDDEIALLECSFYLLAIYLYGIAEILAIDECIEIAWDNLAANPTWDADLEGKLATAFLDVERYVTIPWIVGFRSRVTALPATLVVTVFPLKRLM